ncbi:restriction endonuclease subunit S [Pseudomonas sp. SWRI154]|uniref:restriction endonuclease subunit S n=1 Tax=Pseudomonas sp. SWRI154 TaxID=2745501 RepID=UPI001645FE6E|nr:restriction endonuclease subunit S [Pseudomonas sp. SWRI154]MBC3365538.1 restriction endonuclease subunit S [Pseudomonas sp. SWRI154]
MSEWQDFVVEDIAAPGKNSLATGPFGSSISSKFFVAQGVPVIRGGNLSSEVGKRLNDEGLVFVSTDKAEEFSRSIVSLGDLIFTCWGTINQVGLIDNRARHLKYVISNKQMKLSVDHSKAHPLFLYYLFSSPEKQQEILNNGIGAAVPGFNLGQLRKMVISLPKPDEQKAIAAVLNSLDEKIDLLHRQNTTLEAMSKTLFRHWFTEGPRNNWTERSLSHIARFLNGLACQKYLPENDLDKLPVLKIRELSGGISDNSDWATNQVKSDYIVEAGDVIFAWSASLMVKIWDGERCVLNQHLFKVTSDQFPKWYYLLWCKHHLAEFISISSSHATTMGHIKRGDLDAAMVLVPTAGELEEMSTQMEPLLDKQIANAKQMKSLEKLRDTLLPKVINGEVRVSF